MTGRADELRAAAERLQSGHLTDRALAVALNGWLSDAAHFWDDVGPVERTHALAVAQAINTGGQP